MAPTVRQLSILMENRVGRLMEVAKVMSREAINIRAISVVEVSDFGIVRVIVDDPDSALAAFARSDLVAAEHEVLAVELEDLPGTLVRVLALLVQAELDLQYTYGLLEKSNGKPVIILRVRDVNGAGELLREAGFDLLGQEDIRRLGEGGLPL